MRAQGPVGDFSCYEQFCSVSLVSLTNSWNKPVSRRFSCLRISSIRARIVASLMASSLRGDQSRDSEPDAKSTSRPIRLAASVARLALLLSSTLNESALDARDDMDECREYVPESWRSGVGAG